MAKKSILGEFMQSSAGKKLGFDNHIKNIHYAKIKRPQRNRELRRIDELAEDIREDGLENNLLVRTIEDDRYEVELIDLAAAEIPVALVALVVSCAFVILKDNKLMKKYYGKSTDTKK